MRRKGKTPPMITRHKKQIWFCAIGECDLKKFAGRSGLDAPMRDFITAAYVAVTGEAPKFLFSGWNHKLTPSQREVVNNK